MEHIIQQLALDMAKEITEKALYGGLTDIDALSSEILPCCKGTACRILETIVESLNLNFRENKEDRKSLGLVIKEKDRDRSLLTELGPINIHRDCYYNKYTGHCETTLDKMIGIDAYARTGSSVCAKLLESATQMSYAKSSKAITGDYLSRQSVHDIVGRAPILEAEAKTFSKPVKELHIYADEDHVHLQKEGKQKGKKNGIVPLVTVTEGIQRISKSRNKTINACHFVDENFSTENLWESVTGYLLKAYDTENAKVYIYGDGGPWIKKGLEEIPNSEFVVDGYHYERDLRRISKLNPQCHFSQRMHMAALRNDKEAAKAAIQDLKDGLAGESLKEAEIFSKFIISNWDAIVRKISSVTTGSCTEAQVSHVLSERFSRNPMGWSEKNLGILTKARTYCLNGGEINAKDFKSNSEERQSYREYAEEMIKSSIGGCLDWSMFDLESTNAMAGTSYYRTENGGRGRLLS